MDVARRCSVAPSTVSRVLNNARHGRFSVSEAVREKILRVARELNYRPSMAARNLAIGKTKLVAVLGLQQILSNQVGPTERGVSAMYKIFDDAGYDICLPLMSRRHPAFDMPGLRVDGVVVAGALEVEHLDSVERADVPYVSLNGAPGPHGSLVAPDDAGGMRLVVEHLVSLGHTRIAYMDFPSAGGLHPSVMERRDAFRKLRQSLKFQSPNVDLPPVPRDTPWDVINEPFLRQAVLDGGATAVITYSHQMALSISRVAHDLGLSIPRDLSLACFNDEPVLSLAVPSITAVRVPGEEMGRVAAQLLLEQMGSDDPLEFAPRRIVLDESLAARESTAPPPSSSSSSSSSSASASEAAAAAPKEGVPARVSRQPRDRAPRA